MRMLSLAAKTAWRRAGRSALTVTSVMLTVLVICLAITLLRALDRPDPATTRGVFRLVTHHRLGIRTRVPASMTETIREMPGVRASASVNAFGGRYLDTRARNIFTSVAVDPASIVQVFDDARITAGSAEAWIADPTGCMVGQNLVERFGWKVGDTVVLVGDTYPVTLRLTIRAVYSMPEGNSSWLFLPRRYLDESWPPAKNLATTLWTRCGDAAAVERVAQHIDETWANSDHPTISQSESVFQLSLVAMVGDLQAIFVSFVTVVGAILAVILANTMLVSSRERIRDFAVLRALGFTSVDIVALVAGESLLVATTGGVLAVALFSAGFAPLKSYLVHTALAPVASDMVLWPKVLLVALLAAGVMGLVSGLPPALASSRRSVVDGLRRLG